MLSVIVSDPTKLSVSLVSNGARVALIEMPCSALGGSASASLRRVSSGPTSTTKGAMPAVAADAEDTRMNTVPSDMCRVSGDFVLSPAMTGQDTRRMVMLLPDG